MEKNRTRSSDIKELKARKAALKQEMEQIQGQIENSLSEVRHSFMDRTKLTYWINKYPLHLLTSALVAGFFLARRSGGTTDRPDGTVDNGTIRTQSASKTRDSTFTGLLIEELKKLATQRAAKFVTQRIEEAIEQRNKKEE